MIAIDYTLFIQIGLFLFLWFFLSRFVFPPFLRLLEEREHKTEGVKSEAKSAAEEAERLRVAYEKEITRATEEGNAIKEEIRQEALQAREKLLNQVREETTHFLQTVRNEIQQEMQKGLVVTSWW